MKPDRRHDPDLERFGIVCDALEKLAVSGDVDAADRLAELSNGRNVTAADDQFIRAKITR